MCTLLLIKNGDSFHIFQLSGTAKLADGCAETDGKEPVAPAAAEVSCVSEDQTTPESRDLPAENSEAEHDCSAMEVE